MYSCSSDYYDIATDELVIECHIRAAPAPIIRWTKDAIEIKVRGRYRTTHEGSTYQLLISHPIFADTGKYTCEAENAAAKVHFGHFVFFEGKEAHLHVAGIYHARGRKNIDGGVSKMEDILAVVRGEVEDLGELAEAAEPGEPGEAVEPGTKKTKKGKKGGKEIVGRLGGITTKKKLSFASTLKDRTVFSGQTLKLSLTVIGPEPNIKWLKNGCNIVFGAHAKNFTKEGYACIEVYDINEEDSGEYSCVAKNNAGEITTTGRITVYSNQNEDAVAPIFLLPIRGR